MLPHIGDLPAGTKRVRGFLFGDRAFENALGQAASAVRGSVPAVHRFHDGFGLMNGDDRTFGQNVELSVRDNGGDLNDAVDFGLQSRHFHV